MAIKRQEKADSYFREMTKKVVVREPHQIVTFGEYLNHRYRDNCYFYSGYAIMGLTSDDFLVRGDISVRDYFFYPHGWVEFSFKGNEYVFDSLIKGIFLKKDWYKNYYPRVTFRKSQKEILDKYLDEKFANYKDGSWHFNDFIFDEEELDHSFYYQHIQYNEKNGCLPAVLADAVLEISLPSRKIVRFTAYSDSIG